MSDTKTKEYTVTEKAGIYVAGRRSPGEGNKIKLTVKQAETPLRNDEIVEPEQFKKRKTKMAKAKAKAEAKAKANARKKAEAEAEKKTAADNKDGGE